MGGREVTSVGGGRDMKGSEGGSEGGPICEGSEGMEEEGREGERWKCLLKTEWKERTHVRCCFSKAVLTKRVWSPLLQLINWWCNRGFNIASLG